MAKGSMPVLVGAGQAVSHWQVADGSAAAPSPLSLARDAAKAALHDSNAPRLAAEIDTLAFVRIFEDSVPGDNHPHGHNTNLPGTLARDIGAAPRRAIYSSVGGQGPQQLVNEFASAIHAGEMECGLIAGSEAIGASKAARRAGLELDWTDGAALEIEDRGMGDMLLSRTEIKHGLVSPPYFYALFETAIAAREGRTRSQQRTAMSQLFAPFSQVAAANPYAQFPQARDAQWLASPSKDNYELADPFLKWHVAQDAVNLGAAVIIMSDDKADALGIAQHQRIYLHGAGEAGDDFISQRPVLDGSFAMDKAVARALEQAGRTAAQMSAFDLYSCFPCAVFSACAALGVDWESEKRPLTLTGGLPFFGGPGNNYSLHGIAAMIERLRAHPDDFGLVLANGGWMSKEAVGVYSATRPADFSPVEPAAKPDRTVSLAQEPGHGTLETYTVVHARGVPQAGICFGRTGAGARFIATAEKNALERLRADENLCGAPICVTCEGEVCQFSFE